MTEEQRQAAIEAINPCRLPRHVLDALIALGWRPAPVVDDAMVERERIASALDHEASTCPCAEDAAVIRDCAMLVRANFSYADADVLSAVGRHPMTRYRVTVTIRTAAGSVDTREVELTAESIQQAQEIIARQQEQLGRVIMGIEAEEISGGGADADQG